MKQYFLTAVFTAFYFCAISQDIPPAIVKDFTIEKINEPTPVKDQAMTGTCRFFLL